MGAGNNVCVSISTAAFGSTPFFWAIERASLREYPAEAIRKFPTSLTSVAAPTSSPKSKIPCAPIAVRGGSDAFFGALWTCKGNPELVGDSCLRPSKDGCLDIDTAMLCMHGRKLLCRFGQHRAHRKMDTTWSQLL